MIKISTAHIEIGMYVAVLDRSWIGTPFLFQSFLISSKKHIRQLQELCRTVDIDENKSDPALRHKLRLYQIRDEDLQDGMDVWSHVVGVHRKSYNLRLANKVYENSITALHSVLSDFRHNKQINPAQITACVRGVIDGVTQNPDVLALFGVLKSTQQDTVRHSINVCILSLLFGRHLGLNEQQLADLGCAALLHDVGEIRISQAVLDKQNRGLSSKEKQEMELHVIYGEELLQSIPDISAVALKVVRSHHERVNGKGYPDGLKGDEIDYFARLVSIVDAYEIVINHPNDQVFVSYPDALKSIYMMRGSFFDTQLVEQFMKCLGTYPIGSVVELSNHEIAIVISTKPGKNLLPIVIVVKDSDGIHRHPNIVDLEDSETHVGLPEIYITKVLNPKSVGITVSDYMRKEAGVWTGKK